MRQTNPKRRICCQNGWVKGSIWLDLCDTWRIRNLLEKSFIFWQNQSSSGVLNARLDYIFISKKLQNFSNKAITLPASKTDHSSVSVIISNYNEIKPDHDPWKFNNSLISDEKYIENFIENLKVDLDSENSFNDKVELEYMKSEIRKFMISYSKIRKENNTKIKETLEIS